MNPDQHARDKHFLDIAARAAMQSAGDVEPNPMVGCVIAEPGELPDERAVLAVGHHERFGGPHAERRALAEARARGIDPRGKWMYVTLEPCCHTGKQPPCTEAILEAGIERVVYARSDPGQASAGGARILERAGVPCRFTDASPLASALAEPFARPLEGGLPWVIAKWAQTIDGYIADRDGGSKWISNERSRKRVHEIRARSDVIVTGLGTLLADKPMLTARGVQGPIKRARRVVLVPRGALDRALPVALDMPAGPPVTILTAADAGGGDRITSESLTGGVELVRVPAEGTTGRAALEPFLRHARDAWGATAVLVEAGTGVLTSFFRHGLIDELKVYIAGRILGDAMGRPALDVRAERSIGDAERFRLVRSNQLLDDIELTYWRAVPAEV